LLSRVVTAKEKHYQVATWKQMEDCQSAGEMVSIQGGSCPLMSYLFFRSYLSKKQPLMSHWSGLGAVMHSQKGVV
jgi:hypothetical protein